MSVVRKSWGWIALGALFLRELILSVGDVAMTVLRPSRVRQSAVVAIPLDVKSDAGITLLANLITLTPGTTSLHVSEDRAVLYAHVLSVSDDSVEKIKRGFERRVMEVLP